MTQFRRGGLCVQCCGSSTDLEGRANFELSLETCHLRDNFIIDGHQLSEKFSTND